MKKYGMTTAIVMGYTGGAMAAFTGYSLVTWQFWAVLLPALVLSGWISGKADSL